MSEHCPTATRGTLNPRICCINVSNAAYPAVQVPHKKHPQNNRDDAMDANSFLQTMFCWIDGTIHAELQSEEIVIVGNMEDFLAPPAGESFCSKDIHFFCKEIPVEKKHSHKTFDWKSGIRLQSYMYPWIGGWFS